MNGIHGQAVSVDGAVSRAVHHSASMLMGRAGLEVNAHRHIAGEPQVRGTGVLVLFCSFSEEMNLVGHGCRSERARVARVVLRLSWLRLRGSAVLKTSEDKRAGAGQPAVPARMARRAASRRSAASSSDMDARSASVSGSAAPWSCDSEQPIPCPGLLSTGAVYKVLNFRLTPRKE